MDTMEIIEAILKAVLVPLLPLVTLVITLWVKKKTELIMATLAAHDREYLSKYVELAEDAIIKSVVFVNQTYVEALKKDDAFSKENQLAAFELAKTQVLAILTEDTKDALDMLYGDYMKFIDTTIEEMVNYQKLE